MCVLIITITARLVTEAMLCYFASKMKRKVKYIYALCIDPVVLSYGVIYEIKYYVFKLLLVIDVEL